MFNLVDDTISHAIDSYWTGFAKNQVPGSGPLPENPKPWTQFLLPNEKTMYFEQNKWKIIQNYEDENCKFWNDVGYFWF